MVRILGVFFGGGLGGEVVVFDVDRVYFVDVGFVWLRRRHSEVSGVSSLWKFTN